MVDVVDFKVRLSEFVVSSGSTILLSENDALIIVGPNNSGKSQLLRDIEAHFERQQNSVYTGKVVKKIRFDSPSSAEMIDRLEPLKDNVTEHYSSCGVRVPTRLVVEALQWGHSDISLSYIAPFLLKRISSDDRLSIVAPSPGLTETGPQTPGQVLFDSESVLDDVSRVFNRAFRKDLFLDYRAGANIPIYVGSKPVVPAGKDRVSDEYVKLVRSNDKLHEQGDGMKSFGGILLSTLVINYNITLVDEPEAFLHPPQERIIGRMIAEETSGQVICSTHSKNVLQGFLESSRQEIRVLRIVRDGTTNRVSEISPTEIADLWNDPVFRYSTALEALFHDRTVLCEADADCRFFEAIETHIQADDRLDTHYVPCGGKGAFPKFIKALRKLNIPVLAILDLDVLNEEEMIKRIYEAQGGAWTDISALWSRLDKAVREGVAVDTLEQTKAKLIRFIEEWQGGAGPVSDIVEVIKQKKPWGKVKAAGLAAIPPGDASRYADDLLVALAARHIFPIPVGTLENFVRSVGNHGIKWLSEVFTKHEPGSDALREAREFTRKALSI